MKVPASYTQVEGWRESFIAARERQEKTRTDSLFPEIHSKLCGEVVREFSMRDWTILDAAKNPIVAGGQAGVQHASNIIWQLRTGWKRRVSSTSKLGVFLRSMLMHRLLKRYNYFEMAIIVEVSKFVDDALMDMPVSKGATSFNPAAIPRIHPDVMICGEVMNAFPSMTFEMLHNMPLAQFWQWLNAARKKEDPEYRNDQPTDEVNRRALAEKNRLKREAKAAQNGQ